MTYISLEISSEAMATDETAHEGCNPTNVMATRCVNVVYRKLFEVARKGDLRAVNQIIDRDSKVAMANVIITSDQQYTTLTLDVVVIVGQDEMIENLVYRILEEDCHLILHRALKVALKGGKLRIVKAILDRNSALDTTSLTFLGSATIEKELLWYLVSLIQSPLSDDAMRNLIFAGHSDVGLYLALKYLSPTMAMEIINQLAIMPHLFYSGSRLNLCERLIYKCIPLCLVNTSLDNSENTKMARGTFVNLFNEWTNMIESISFMNLIDKKNLGARITSIYTD